MEKKDYSKLKVWLDGRIVDYRDAKVPILTHSLQYGSGIFEGIRAYKTNKGRIIFRLRDHVKRFLNSAKICYMNLEYNEDEIFNAIVKVVKENDIDPCYIRPFAFYNTDQIGLSAYNKKTSVFIAALPFGAYFGSGKEKGIKCKISSWHRINSDIVSVRAKSSGNYVNSILGNFEAKYAGFDDAIFISENGYVAEGSAENIFIVNNNKLITPDEGADILFGITRDSLIKIAKTIGIDIEERQIHKDELYTADEVFFSGTAAEITPIINIDGHKIGNEKLGPITKMLSDKFYDIINGNDEIFNDWLTYV
ncbi:MAG: branched-chain amino acid transaminase [Candidatus Marsarchaeota archaeon]|jgi:branched-chain amino acid aminotransferase|nr:branched-chain amino acid transaminase [Candidatus Marsarchaeota archaeon]